MPVQNKKANMVGSEVDSDILICFLAILFKFKLCLLNTDDVRRVVEQSPQLSFLFNRNLRTTGLCQ